MVTLISKKYNVLKTLFGQFVSGRPFQVILLSNNICLINVHLPHIQNLYDELIKIENYLFNNNINLTNYRIIIGGDFNIDITNTNTTSKIKLKFMNKTLTNKTLTNSKSSKTCCIKDDNIINLKYNFDYILDSDNKIIKTKLVFPHKNNLILPASDHIGIYCKLIK